MEVEAEAEAGAEARGIKWKRKRSKISRFHVSGNNEDNVVAVRVHASNRNENDDDGLLYYKISLSHSPSQLVPNSASYRCPSGQILAMGFLVACSRLYKRPSRSVDRSVDPSSAPPQATDFEYFEYTIFLSFFLFFLSSTKDEGQTSFFLNGRKMKDELFLFISELGRKKDERWKTFPKLDIFAWPFSSGHFCPD